MKRSTRRSWLMGLLAMTLVSAPLGGILPAIARPTSLSSTTIAANTLSPQAAVQRQPLTIYQPLQPLPWEGFFHNRYGVAYFSLDPNGDIDSGVIESDVEEAQAMHDTRKESRIWAKLGLKHAMEEEFDRAIEAYTKSLQIARENNDDEVEGVALGSLALLRSQKGFFDADTIDYLQQYWQWTRQQGDRKAEEIALSNLGNAYLGADLPVQAIEIHQKRLQLARKIGDRAGEARALGNLGLVQEAIGNFDKALSLHQQHLTIAQEIRDVASQKLALANLGVTYHWLENYDKEITTFQDCLRLAKQTEDFRYQAIALGNLAGAAYFQGDYAKAIDLYEQAWSIGFDRLHDADILYGLRGNEGLAYFQQGNYDKALELYQQYYTYVYSRNNRRGEAIAKNNVAVLRIQQGNLAEAEKKLREAIAFLESLRGRLGSNDAFKVSIFDTQTVPYTNLQWVLLHNQRSEAALEVAEQSRSRAFAELLHRRVDRSAIPPKDTPPNLAQIQQIAKATHATLVEYTILAETEKSLSKTEDAALKTQESELLIWVVQPNGKVTLRRSPFLVSPNWQEQTRSLADLVVDSRDAIGVRGRGGIRIVTQTKAPQTDPPLQQLHRLLIDPIADLLPKNPEDLVVFLPQQSLFLVPFAALQDASGQSLIQKHTIVMNPSIQVLGLAEAQQTRIQRHLFSAPLIVGNPTMPSVPLTPGDPPQPLDPLPGAEAEAKAIGQLLKIQPLIGAQATEPTVVQRMGQASLVHLATHGLLDDFQGSGVPGAIALAPAGKENGLLTADDILRLKLNADLVVLSACNTGQGRITGDGVVGLSRSLMAAGVPSVLVSLWSVPDTPTATLMTQFYRALQTQPNKAKALRQAMLETMKQNPDPKDWSSFVLVGAP